MGTMLALPEQRMRLQHVSWDTFERLLSDRLNAPTPRFNFDRAVL